MSTCDNCGRDVAVRVIRGGRIASFDRKTIPIADDDQRYGFVSVIRYFQGRLMFEMTPVVEMPDRRLEEVTRVAMLHRCHFITLKWASTRLNDEVKMEYARRKLGLRDGPVPDVEI